MVRDPFNPTSEPGLSGRRATVPDECIGATVGVFAIGQHLSGWCEEPFRRGLSSVPAVREHVSRQTRPCQSK